MNHPSPLALPEPPPVEVSGYAMRSLSEVIRRWSGWPNARFIDAVPQASPYGETQHDSRTITMDLRRLMLNPNRVLLTVTPFRLRQEAVISGVMMHEAAHARHTHWVERDIEKWKACKPGTTPMHHGPLFEDGPGNPPTAPGEPVTAQTLAFARLLEEARIEGLIARDAETGETAEQMEARGMAWTMRAAMAALAPLTNLSNDPDQQVMDVISSWVLRAGKQLAVAHWTKYQVPEWVNEFTKLQAAVLDAHFKNMVDDDNDWWGENEAEPWIKQRTMVFGKLIEMLTCVDDTGTYMVDKAREILTLLYPDGNQNPMPSGGTCGEAGEAGIGLQKPGQSGAGSQSNEGNDGDGKTEGEEQADNKGETNDADSGSGANSPQEGAQEPSQEQQGGGESDQEDSEGGESQGSGERASDRVSDSAKQDEQANELLDQLAELLKGLEKDAGDQAKDEAQDTIQQAGGGIGAGDPNLGGGWRLPDAEDRVRKAKAEKFLRDLIAPTEQSKILLTDSPSATVDATTYAAWKARGAHGDPRFFTRTRRTVQPAPPIKIATLVDVSESMDPLQKPSSLMSWALAAAALDLRNFAGRGVQIESCLIHWGSAARVIQEVGQTLPGVREFKCAEGTTSLGQALELVEQQMPGFFDGNPDAPENRLLVNFTDWELYPNPTLIDYMRRGLASGVNMLTVAPRWSSRNRLNDVLKQCTLQRGGSHVVIYSPGNPDAVWDAASAMLNGHQPAAGAGMF